MGQGVFDEVYSDGIMDYRRGSNLMRGLLRQLQSSDNPYQYLTQLLTILDKVPDQTLKEIVQKMKNELIK